jgi:hypothetical protein
MTRRYNDAVEVHRRDDVPAAFLWHGRLYSVRAVLAHWVEAGGWWRFQRSGTSADGPAALDDREREIWRVEAGPGRAAGSRTGRAVETSLGIEGRAVETSLGIEGRAVETSLGGTYDLCFHWSAGGWTLTRTHD